MSGKKLAERRADPSRGGLMNPEWEYTAASSTDIRALFNRIRAQQQKQQRMHQVKEKSQ